MSNLITYIIGVASGALVVLVLAMYFDVHLAQVIYDVQNRHSADAGFVRGSVPDFEQAPARINVFKKVDSGWSLIAPDQEEVVFHSLEGKVLFLSRWATWCGPCIEEMPEIDQLKQNLDSDEVMFMLYSDEQDQVVREFDNQTGLSIYTSVGYLPDYLDFHSLPGTIIIDKRGVVRYKHEGMASWSDPEVQSFLQSLIEAS